MDQCQGCLSSIFSGNGGWSPPGEDADFFDWRSSNNFLMAQGASTPVEAPVFESSSSNPSPQDIDYLMAKEMAAMSLMEREVAESEVHGISDNVEDERPEILDDCLAEMDLNLEEMKAGTAYELAEKMSKEYVTSRKLRSLFIRADRWNTWEASERMIKFFELKRKLFGDEKLVKDIQLEDLDEDDMDSLRAGHHQLSPHKDSAGRLILVGMIALRKFKTMDNMLRAAYYMYMSAVETVESQRKGVTVISYTVDNSPRSQFGNFRQCLPVHLASHHFCYNDPRSYAEGARTVLLMTRVQRARFRRHYGNHLECLYRLKSFGIPDNAIPVTTSGELLTSYHLFWLETRRAMEQAKHVAHGGPLTTAGLGGSATLGISSSLGSVSTEIIGIDKNMTSSQDPLQPGKYDVLLGRGKTGQDHPGNLRFREFMDRSMKQFEQGTKSETMALGQAAVDLVKASGGRFLSKEGSKGWEEVGFGASARKRVVSAFKNHRRKFHNVKTLIPLISSSS